MKTPAEFTKNLKNNIITQEMLETALLSVNKRAKNMRDNQYYYYNIHDRYGNAENAKAKKLEFYKKKEFLLRLLKPCCIHKEIVQKHRHSAPVYYLFYQLGDHSFHSPITEGNIKKYYPNLEIKQVELDTSGKDINDLVSIQFVEKLIKLIKSKNYQYISNSDEN